MPLTMPKICLPIAAKAELLIAGLGLMSGLANWLCLLRIDTLDQLNSVVTEQVSPARLALEAGKTCVELFGLATYKMYASSDAAGIKEAAERMQGEYEAALNALNNMLSYFPKRSEDIERIRYKLTLAHGIALEVHELIAADQRAKARDFLDLRFDPARDDVSFQINRLINILGGEAKDMLDQAQDAKAWTLRLTIFMLAGGSLATLVLALGLAHLSVARPLSKLALKMTGFAQGDFAAEIEGTGRGDEVGTMARAVAVFKRNGLALCALQAQQASDRARAEAEKQASLTALADAFEREVLSVADALADAAHELEQFARSMHAVAEDSGERAHAAAADADAEETTEGANSVAIAVEEMSVTIGDISSEVVEASNVVAEATGRANVAVTNSENLATAVQYIDRVVGLITTIAGQTNLLALNATIEVVQRTRRVSSTIADVSQFAGQTGRVAEQIQVSAENLSWQASVLVQQAQDFAGRVRAG